MLTKQQTEDFLRKLDPMEKLMKYAYEHGENIAWPHELSEEQIVSYKAVLNDILQDYDKDCELYKICGFSYNRFPPVYEKPDSHTQGHPLTHTPAGRANPPGSSRYTHTHMTHFDYSLENGKNLCIVRHNRYAPASMHDHEFIELSYVFSGKCHHDFTTSKGSHSANSASVGTSCTSVDMAEGELIIIPPGMTHQIAVYDGSVILNILVNRNTFQGVFLQNLPSGNLLYQFFWQMIFSEGESSYLIFKKTDKNQIRDYVVQLVMEYVVEAPYTPQVCEHLLGILFLKLMESAKETSLSPHLPKGAEQIAPMILYIQKNYQKLTLEELASEFHYSRANINNIFKKYTGTTIRQYTKKLRLQKAERLLQDNRLSVEEISMEVGYNDISYFIEQFKTCYGMTPLQYRKSNTFKG